MDREKVAKGLKCLMSMSDCTVCPYSYNKQREYCLCDIGKDALALLKEQQEYIEYWSAKYDEFGKAYMNVRDERDALLKEQEAVSVKTDYVDGFGNPITNCPSCKSRLFWCSNKHYCGECGQHITWEGR